MNETIGLACVFAIGVVGGVVLCVALSFFAGYIERALLLKRMKRDFIRMKQTDEWKQTFITKPEEATK